MDLFTVKNVSFSYPASKKQALKAINLTVRQGEFIVLCGTSGCGKSTLLRQFKKEITPHGSRTGEILYDGQPLEKIELRKSASEIGFVMQNPDNQIVTDKVWHELAFGLENLGIDSGIIRRRVAEIASFLGIAGWFRKNVNELSGGQKQMLNLASVMVMQPKILILDEPTSQLDPIAATEFIETLRKLNRDLGITILLSEHRLEEAFGVADRVLVMDGGKIVFDGTPRAAAKDVEALPIYKGFPAVMRIYHAVEHDVAMAPVSVKEGRQWIDRRYPCIKAEEVEPKERKTLYAVLKLDEVWFRYEKDLPDVLRGVKLEAYRGEVLCILGANGAGKSTLLGTLAGIYKPYRGRIRLFGEKTCRRERSNRKTVLLPQAPQALFTQNSVKKELEEVSKQYATVVERLGLSDLLDAHPFDLSGGEMQKVAFAKLLLTNPEILLLDEPTKGLDAAFKEELAEILRLLAESGKTIILATHDIEFAAQYTDRCAMFFDGEVISEDTPTEFFAGNSYYTTSANRIVRHRCPKAITCGDVIERIQQCTETNG
jgi:energy-coupling factor transporter ATP-binding protein EcfA2